MAVGVPEEDVFAAADAVLARGERPTVERVRLELGRGSPARVGGLLDLWWGRLSARLKAETRLPALPSDVSQAFITVWQQATHSAREAADIAFVGQRRELSEERLRVENIVEQANLELALSRERTADETRARLVLEARLADLDLLLEQRQAQVDVVQGRFDDVLFERNLARQEAETAKKQLAGLRLKADQDRVALEKYSRGVEERAHREVDLLRQELKTANSQLKAINTVCIQLQRKLDMANNELNAALQTAAGQQARSETLMDQLTQLRKTTLPKRKASPQNPARLKNRIKR